MGDAQVFLDPIIPIGIKVAERIVDYTIGCVHVLILQQWLEVVNDDLTGQVFYFIQVFDQTEL